MACNVNVVFPDDYETIKDLVDYVHVKNFIPKQGGWGLVDEGGIPIAPSDGFRALRDSINTSSEGIEEQRSDYEALFEQLEASGFSRGDLQAAWWFHTASTESILKDLLIMRDDAELLLVLMQVILLT